jgi:uncharacterized protein YfkK (UPF0435 family)
VIASRKDQLKINIQSKINDVAERLKLLEQGIFRKPKTKQGTAEEQKELFKFIKSLHKNFPNATYSLVAGIITDKLGRGLPTESVITEVLEVANIDQSNPVNTPSYCPDKTDSEKLSRIIPALPPHKALDWADVAYPEPKVATDVQQNTQKSEKSLTVKSQPKKPTVKKVATAIKAKTTTKKNVGTNAKTESRGKKVPSAKTGDTKKAKAPAKARKS